MKTKHQSPAVRIKRRAQELWRKYRRWSPILVIPLFFLLNWTWHAIRKPSEVIGLLESGFYKDPKTTWETFGPLFEANSTVIISPELLAALAQTESRGNPIARTYWRWRGSGNPFSWYAPASSAMGLFQITDGTFAEASQYCLHFNKVARRTVWYDLSSCWFNWFYNRLIPAHSVEMTGAYLHVVVEKLSEQRPMSLATKQDVAALTHLCGRGVASTYVKNGFRLGARSYCDAHNPRLYLKKIHELMTVFRAVRQNARLPF